ncbi:hypothetical protein [Pseudomonas sp. NFPP28]|uniref:hypothetical protein n=1 Tax=Pseudomonas sp. NFPP28 TaxID=1566231 RepID=UPI0008EA1180|nr:hypothetical protein [Pseudomonas sp. NFPP28]SFQ05950.1 hypothetical protein SAMN03159315_05657 [Pseudomonas sp. NFPP28]
MQNELKTAIRFDDFYAAFRSKGVVAMAWWLGAMHAEQIRADHQSFPFLHIVGGPGSGKSFLISYLWKLLGEEEFTACSPEYATPAGRTRALFNASKPIVIFESVPNAESTFDWEELRDLYNSGGTTRHVQRSESQTTYFRGALSIISNAPLECSEMLDSRIVRIQLGSEHTQESMNGAMALRGLSAEQAGVFGLTVKQSREQLLSTFNKLAPTYTAAWLEESAGPSKRAAKNGGQLIAWVDVLSSMLDLSNEQRLTALNTIKLIIDEDFHPF